MDINFQSYAAIFFILLMLYFLIKNKSRIQLQKILHIFNIPIIYFAMYKTQLGIAFMEKVAKKIPRLLKWIAYVGIAMGFIGMGVMGYSLISNLVKMFTTPAAVSSVALVLPFKVKGSFYVPFFYWIISIFLLAIVHEFSHGLMARVYDVKVKSSGFAFLGIIFPIVPAAFVEPDEKELEKKSATAKLSIFAAGPFSNILFAVFIALIFWLVFTPLASAIFIPDGIQIAGYVSSENMTFPAEMVNMTQGDIILKVNGVAVSSIENFTIVLNNTKPGQKITVETNRTSYSVTLASNPEFVNKSYLGIYTKQNIKIRDDFQGKYGRILTSSLIWIIGLFYWLGVLNLGIGLFNLVPLGPIDGGRMLLVVLKKYLREDLAIKLWKFISFVFLFVIIASIFFAFAQ